MASTTQYLAKPLSPIISSIPPHLEIFETHEPVVNLPKPKDGSAETVPKDLNHPIGWNELDDEPVIVRRNKRNNKYDRPPSLKNKRTRRRQPVTTPPSSPPPSEDKAATTQQQAFAGWGDACELNEHTGWTDDDEPDKATGWDSDSDTPLPDKATGWSDTPSLQGAKGWNSTPSPKRKHRLRGKNKRRSQRKEPTNDDWQPVTDPFPESARAGFWTSLSRIWLTDYSLHELSEQIRIAGAVGALKQSGAKYRLPPRLTRAPFRRPRRHVPDNAVDEWAYIEDEARYIPTDWNQEQAVVDQRGFGNFLYNDQAEKLEGRDRSADLAEVGVGETHLRFEGGVEAIERTLWEIAKAKRMEIRI